MASRTIARFHSVKAVRNAGHNPADFRPATVKEIFGPDFKPLMWVGKSAYVVKEVEVEEITPEDLLDCDHPHYANEE